MSRPMRETVFELKVLSAAAIPAALERAERYRLLNEPTQAESICLDILEVDPKNQSALILLLLSLTDQFDESGSPVERALAVLPRFESEYHRKYYEGVIYERQARARLHRTAPGGATTAYYLLRQAMDCYDAAENIRPSGNDESLLRWNTCARTIMSGNLQPSPVDDAIVMLE
jgi:tetratricopeptide (TPR) repeat protein